jgi:hypothetical protein
MKARPFKYICKNFRLLDSIVHGVMGVLSL